jgi:hypothetical protein
LALEGRTVRLGQLLSAAGVSTIVVMNASAPELEGVQSVPLHHVPGNLLTALGRQSDLSLVLSTRAVEVFSNSLFHGIVSMTSPGSSTAVPVLSSTSNSGPLLTNSTVRAGFAPASAFSLLVNGQPAPRSTRSTWTSYFQVGPSTTSPVGQIVLQRLPLNGLLAAFTLLMWLLMWLGFGWVHRLEWIFSGRRRRATPRHARSS